LAPKLNPHSFKSLAPWQKWLADAGIFWLFLFALVGVSLETNWLGEWAGLSHIDQVTISGLFLEVAGV
jgi:hypothetical protein